MNTCFESIVPMGWYVRVSPRRRGTALPATQAQPLSPVGVLRSPIPPAAIYSPPVRTPVSPRSARASRGRSGGLLEHFPALQRIPAF